MVVVAASGMEKKKGFFKPNLFVNEAAQALDASRTHRLILSKSPAPIPAANPNSPNRDGRTLYSKESPKTEIDITIPAAVTWIVGVFAEGGLITISSLWDGFIYGMA